MGLTEAPVQDGRKKVAMTDKTPAAPVADTKAADTKTGTTPPSAETAAPAPVLKGPEQKPGEIGGPKGPEPTRYGDWEFKGRCSDF